VVLKVHNGCSRKKIPEWVFKTQPLFIYAQKTAILKMHMVRIKDLKNHGGRNHAPKSACQALKLENKDFWLTKYGSPTSTLNTSRETLAVWIL
jgi:hypothetical protein